MSEASSEPIVLKILSGVQSGVDVVLVDGEYTIGSGQDDDLQFYDVSLQPGHARLRVTGGKMELRGAAGSLRTSLGIVLATEGEFQEIEPLDVVSAGTTRFAMGRGSANWASIAEENGRTNEPARPRRAAERKPSAGARVFTRRTARTGLPVALVLLLLAGGVWLAPFSVGGGELTAETGSRNALDLVRKAVDGFDFGRPLKVVQEVDGAIYVTGYVEQPVERRAVVAAVHDTGVPARVRLNVLASIREETGHLLEAEGAGLSSAVDRAGVATLGGTILDPGRAAKIVDLVKDRIVGLSSVVSQIRTAPSLLADVQDLAKRSQIAPLVLLRLDGSLIEASGVIPTEKIDPWVGFLQAYSTQYAKLIPLRSLVRLQNPDGTFSPAPQGASGPALIVGDAPGAAGNDTALDISRLISGHYELGDVFVGPQPGQSAAAPQQPPAAPRSSQPPVRSISVSLAGGDTKRPRDAAPAIAPVKVAFAAPEDEAAPSQSPSLDKLLEASGSDAAGALAAGVADRPAGPADGWLTKASLQAQRTGKPVRMVGDGPFWAPGAASKDAAATPAATPAPASAPAAMAASAPAGEAGDSVTSMARRLIEMWTSGGLPKDEQGRRLGEGMNALQRGEVSSDNPPIAFDPIAKRYAPLLADGRVAGEGSNACWSNSKLSDTTVAGALFWLDLLSVSRDLSLGDLGMDVQSEVLDAALNPRRTEACAARGGHSVRSIYLTEVGRNPDFITFIARNLEPYSLDIAGADVAEGRYIQTRDGRKMREGAAPDDASRLAIVGELGVAVKREASYATVVFGDRVSWLVQ